MDNFWKVLGGLAVVVALVSGGYYLWDIVFPPKPVVVVDRLCEFVVKDQRMDCVTVLASDSFMKPGAIVDYQASTDGTPNRVPLPVADLFGERCQVPGASLESLKRDLSAPQPISMPQLTFQTNRALQIGADVEVPKFNGLSLKAGPNWSDVLKVELINDDAWATSLDELSAVSAYKSCQILKSCTDHVNSSHYRVVGTTIVAKGLSYKAYNKKGNLISLEAAAKSQQFTASVGGNTDLGSTADTTIKSTGARVIGVRLMPTKVFDGEQSCSQNAVFSPPTGSARVTVSGGGGRGNIGGQRTDDKPLGQKASVSAVGSEASECRADFERVQSQASAAAEVRDDGPGAVRLAYQLVTGGGHYATAAGCFAGNPIGITGHDTTTSASMELRATIPVILRDSSVPSMRVSYSNFPPDSRLEVFDWRSKRLQTAKKETIKGDTATKYEDFGPNVSGTGSATLGTYGPGVYRVEVTFALNAAATGSGKERRNQEASLRVLLSQ